MQKHIGDLDHRHQTKLQSLLELKSSLEIMNERNKQKGHDNPEIEKKNDIIQLLRDQIKEINQETIKSQEEVTLRQKSITMRQSSLAQRQMSIAEPQRQQSLSSQKSIKKIPTLKPEEKIEWNKKTVETEFD